MVDDIEQTFDARGGGNDATERTQSRSLTLLQGGVEHRPSVLPGASVSTTFPVVRDALRHDQPLVRFTPPNTRPPLWSADARWTDITIQHPVPERLDMPAGWGHRWTLSYRHGKNDVTVPVSVASSHDLVTADPIRVNSWHPGKTSRAGLRYMHSTGRHHAHESLFERKLLCVLDFDQVSDVASQPFTLTWHDGKRERHHTPDFAALIDGQLVVINTRPAERLNDRLLEDASAIGEVCLSRGWGHALVVGYALPAYTAVETVEAHARDHDRLGYGDSIVDLLTEQGPTPFAHVCHHFDGHLVARAILQRLIWERRVSIDLNRNLEDSTLVALPNQEPTR